MHRFALWLKTELASIKYVLPENAGWFYEPNLESNLKIEYQKWGRTQPEAQKWVPNILTNNLHVTVNSGHSEDFQCMV